MIISDPGGDVIGGIREKHTFLIVRWSIFFPNSIFIFEAVTDLCVAEYNTRETGLNLFRFPKDTVHQEDWVG